MNFDKIAAQSKGLRMGMAQNALINFDQMVKAERDLWMCLFEMVWGT